MGENNLKWNNWQRISKILSSRGSSIPEKWTTQSKSGPKNLTDISPKKTYRWLMNTWKDAQRHSLSEKCKSKPQWGSEWPPSKSPQGVEKREPCYTTGGNANWYSHYGERCGDAFKKWKQNCHMTQQFQCWAYTSRKPELRETCVPHCSSQHCL